MCRLWSEDRLERVMDKRYCTQCGYKIDDYADDETECGGCVYEAEVLGLSIACTECDAGVGVPCHPGCPTMKEE